MEKHIHTMARIGVSALAIMAMAPTAALAEEERSGIQLLVPTLAELVPACIAFLVVYIILAKMVWPSVVKMMDDREKALTGQMEAAEQAKEKLAETSKQCDEQLAAAHAQAAEIVAHAKHEAEQERARILKSSAAHAAAGAAATPARVPHPDAARAEAERTEASPRVEITRPEAIRPEMAPLPELAAQ